MKYMLAQQYRLPVLNLSSVKGAKGIEFSKSTVIISLKSCFDLMNIRLVDDDSISNDGTSSKDKANASY